MSRKPRIAEFEMLIGGVTYDALKFANGWRNVNIANARDTQAQQLAEHFIQFHTSLTELPTFSGLIEPSAWMANERALQLARDVTKRSKVICSNLTHASIQESCDKLGMETLVVDANPEDNYQVRESELLRVISNQRNEIAVIVSTHGTTQLGNVERIAQYTVIQELRDNGSWLHIDAAFGGVLTQVSSLRNAKIPKADTITIDPYKFIGATGAALLLASPEKLVTKNIPYYNHSKFTRYSTLDASPIAAWFKSVSDVGGIPGMEVMADDCIRNASNIAQNLIIEDIPLVRNPATIIVPVKTHCYQETEDIRNYLHHKGFNVGRVAIKGQNYEDHGIRIACTPRQWEFRGIGDLQGLQREIIKYHQSQKKKAA